MLNGQNTICKGTQVVRLSECVFPKELDLTLSLVLQGEDVGNGPVPLMDIRSLV